MRALLVSGIDSQICDFCIDQANLILKEETSESFDGPVDRSTLPKPIEIKDFLDKYVIGQEDAKKITKCGGA